MDEDEEVNQDQREFIKSIQVSLEKANALTTDLIAATKITPPHPEICQRYLEALQSYINAGQRMILHMRTYFGEGSEELFTRYSGLIDREPGHLN